MTQLKKVSSWAISMRPFARQLGDLRGQQSDILDTSLDLDVACHPGHRAFRGLLLNRTPPFWRAAARWPADRIDREPSGAVGRQVQADADQAPDGKMPRMPPKRSTMAMATTK